MNREIKFRIWDGKKYHYPECELEKTNHYLQFGSNGVFFLHNADGDYITGSKDGGIAEQFTGLKDKNGVDIYEGDILQVNTKIVVCEDDDFFAENELKDQEITCYVSYTEKFAAFELITIEEDRFLKAWGFYGEEDSEDFEVIGSIHSNPELIK